MSPVSCCFAAWNWAGLSLELLSSPIKTQLFLWNLERNTANLCDRGLDSDRAPQWWPTGNGFLPWRLGFSGWKPATGSVPHLLHRKCAFIFHALPSEYLMRCLFLMDLALQWGARSNLWGEHTWNTDPVLWFRAPPLRHQCFSWFFSSASERFSSNDTINTAS